MCSGHGSLCEASTDIALKRLDSLDGWSLDGGGGTLLQVDKGLELSPASQPQCIHAPESWLQALRTAEEFALLHFAVGSGPSTDTLPPPNITIVSKEHSLIFSPPPSSARLMRYTIPILIPREGSRWSREGGQLVDGSTLQRALPQLSSLSLCLPPTSAPTLLSDLRLEYWVQAATASPVADVEQCTCPSGYTGELTALSHNSLRPSPAPLPSGRSCQFCAEGYYRVMPVTSPLTACVPCECGGLSGQCDPLSGDCQACSNNTGGSHCELCLPGFYRDGSPSG